MKWPCPALVLLFCLVERVSSSLHTIVNTNHGVATASESMTLKGDA